MTSTQAPLQTACIWDTPDVHILGVTRSVGTTEETIGVIAYCGKASRAAGVVAADYQVKADAE